MRIKATVAGLIIPVLFIFGILLTSALGYWRTESSKVPVKFTEGIFAGEADPADIRGSYSFSDLEKAFDIPVSTLTKAFGFTGFDNPEDIKIKEFEASYGNIGDLEIGTGSMRLFIALYKGLPFEAETDTAIPQPAWNLLKKEGSTDADILETYSNRVVSLEGFETHETSEMAVPDHTEETDEEKEIKGKTTFSELLDWGLSTEQINEALGMGMGAPGLTVRDFCIDKGIEFSTVKTPLQDLLDKTE
jgi:hypothetical protein